MYDLEHVRTVIREIIENRGIEYKEDDTPMDFDSMQFINMIVEFEEAFNITIDDDYLLLERFSSFVNIQNTLTGIFENSTHKT